jgi:hypothetical protein
VPRSFRRDFLKRLAALPGLAFLSSLVRPAAAAVAAAAADFENRSRPPCCLFRVEGPDLPDVLRGVTFPVETLAGSHRFDFHTPGPHTKTVVEAFAGTADLAPRRPRAEVRAELERRPDFVAWAGLPRTELGLLGVRGPTAAMHPLFLYLGDVAAAADKTLHFEGDGLPPFVVETPCLTFVGASYAGPSGPVVADLTLVASDVRPA